MDLLEGEGSPGTPGEEATAEEEEDHLAKLGEDPAHSEAPEGDHPVSQEVARDDPERRGGAGFSRSAFRR